VEIPESGSMLCFPGVSGISSPSIEDSDPIPLYPGEFTVSR
jgi:hypothetical protein